MDVARTCECRLVVVDWPADREALCVPTPDPLSPSTDVVMTASVLLLHHR